MSPKVIIHAIAFVFVSLFLVWIWDASEQGNEGVSIFYKMIAFIVGAVYFGFLTVVYVLPAVTGKITEEALGSSEAGDPDPFSEAHSYLAKGEYESAIESFRKAAKADPSNRMPWIEISKVWITKFDDPDAAIASLRSALANQGWSVNDAAALMFKIEEIYLKEKNDKESAIVILKQVIEQFPETRHSANATHKLREMGAL